MEVGEAVAVTVDNTISRYKHLQELETHEMQRIRTLATMQTHLKMLSILQMKV